MEAVKRRKRDENEKKREERERERDTIEGESRGSLLHNRTRVMS